MGVGTSPGRRGFRLASLAGIGAVRLGAVPARRGELRVVGDDRRAACHYAEVALESDVGVVQPATA